MKGCSLAQGESSRSSCTVCRLTAGGGSCYCEGSSVGAEARDAFSSGTFEFST